jgi:hypothetical protein
MERRIEATGPSIQTLGDGSGFTKGYIWDTTRNGQVRNNITVGTASNGQEIVFNTPLHHPSKGTMARTMEKAERFIKLNGIKDRMRAKLASRTRT